MTQEATTEPVQPRSSEQAKVLVRCKTCGQGANTTDDQVVPWESWHMRAYPEHRSFAVGPGYEPSVPSSTTVEEAWAQSGASEAGIEYAHKSWLEPERLIASVAWTNGYEAGLAVAATERARYEALRLAAEAIDLLDVSDCPWCDGDHWEHKADCARESLREALRGN